MTEHGLLKSAVFAGVPTIQVDEFVKSVGPDIRDALVELAERRFQAFIGCYRIPVNYSAPNAIQAAIDANKFGYKYVYTDAGNIPLGGIGEAVEQVREVHFGKIMYNRDLPEALKQRGIADGFKQGYVFVNPLTALLWALKNPDVQKDHPLGILFYVGEQLCCLYLDAVDGGRELDVDRDDPGHDWHDRVRFLVVPAPVPTVVPASFFYKTPRKLKSLGEFVLLLPVFASHPTFYRLPPEAGRVR
jgi:hypothetical protein